MASVFFLSIRLALILALYLFLAWSFYILWQDLLTTSRKAIGATVTPLSLIWRDETGRREIAYTKNQVIIGRDPACDCSVNDPTISGQHARLSFHHGQWWVEDLHSTNGSSLNQEPLRIPVVIVSGDLLRCGQVEFQIILGGEQYALSTPNP
mgnify:CR=1 FL=1